MNSTTTGNNFCEIEKCDDEYNTTISDLSESALKGAEIIMDIRDDIVFESVFRG